MVDFSVMGDICRRSAFRHRLGFFFLFMTAALSSCKAPPTRHFRIAGKVVSVNQSNNQIVLNHGEIPGYMPAMVMPLTVRPSTQLATVKKGDEITAILVVANQSSWLESIEVVKRTGTGADPRDAEIRALPTEGRAVPNFTLINQSGRRISVHQYRGKALLITFVYTRCPLPDYCPLMSSNFAEIDKSLRSDPALYQKTHLLTVSFDPKHDTPAVLRSYGAAYTERYSDETFEHWEFASGSAEEIKAITGFFGLTYADAEDQIVHSLVTAIISPQGEIYKVHPSNDWKPAEILAELRAVAR
jgi:protein SCO1/2